MKNKKNIKVLSEDERLDLIVEAVRYCQKVSTLGMPPNSYSKALREPIFFLWESYGKKKYQAARYCSVGYLEVAAGPNAHVYDHAIPFKIIQELLLSIAAPDADNVRNILEKKLVSCMLTRSEDKLLTSLGLRSKMPANSDESDYMARYESAGLKIIPNPAYVPD